MRTIPIALLCSVLAHAAALRGAPQATGPSEHRRHWSVVRSDGSSLYDGTTIDSQDDAASKGESIIRDSKGQTWLLESGLNFERKLALTQITHLPTGEFVRFFYKLPLNARTRREAMAEWRAGNKAAEPFDEVITIETRTVGRTAATSEWRNPEMSADWRSDLRTSLTTVFLDGIERMQPTLFAHDSELEVVRLLARMLSHVPECAKDAAPYSKLIQRPPDCAFDKTLGRPCSKAQVERIERAEKKGVVLSTY
ncbi:MAG: hypothetical protein ACLGH0_14360 [Thermoanaerobaculia bacterium]